MRLTGAGLPAIVVAAGLALTITQDTQDPQAGAPAAAARVATPNATPATAAGPATAKATPATAAGTWSADADGDRIDDRLAARLRTTPAHTPVEVVVRLTSGDADSAIATLRRTLGTFPVTQRYRAVAGFAAALTPAQVRGLAKAGNVARVEADEVVHATMESARREFGVDTATTQLGVNGDAAGDGVRTYGPGDMTVAVLDTGIDARHITLDEGKVLAFRNFVPRQSGCAAPPAQGVAFDDQYHGTHVAGIIAGDGDGVAGDHGVAPGASLVGLKVLACNGSGSMSNVNAAVDWALLNKATYGIDALNLSLGGSLRSDGLDTTSVLLNKATASGLAVFVAAGNAGPAARTIGVPGAARWVTTVGAMADTTAGGLGVAPYSSRGPTADNRVKPDVVAPGTGITAARSGTGNGYTTLSGTSMATPFTAGVGVLALQLDPALAPSGTTCPAATVGDCADGVVDAQMRDPLKALLTTTAQDWGATGPDNDYGYGKLDAWMALTSAADREDLTAPVAPAHAAFTHDVAANTADIWSARRLSAAWPSAVTVIADGPSLATRTVTLRILDVNGAVIGSATGTRQVTVAKPLGSGPYKVLVTTNAAASYRIDASNARLAAGERELRIDEPGDQTVVTEGGAPGDLGIRLLSQPEQPITVNLADPASRVTLTPATLTFTPEDWDQSQTVAVAAPDNDAATGRRHTTVQLTIAEEAAIADGWPDLTELLVRVDDDETADLPVMERADVTTAGAEVTAGVIAGDRVEITPSGRYVLFSAATSQLGSGIKQVYVRDRQTGVTELASASAGGAPAAAEAVPGGISDDGRYVVFETMAANLIAGDTNKCRDVYVRDRWSKTIRRVSLSPSGAQVACAGSQTTTQGRISGDGKVVAWVSNQAGYVTGDTNGAADVFTRDLTTNSNRRVSVSSAGAQGTGTGAAAAIASGLSLSRDGDEVAFASGLNGLVSGDTPGLVDVFLRDRVAGTTVQLNRSTAGAPATGCASTDPRVSADGTKVAFTSCAPNLLNGIADATGGRAAVFVRDVPGVTTTLVSAGPDGLPRPGTESTRPAISADGTHVAFISNAAGLVDGDTNEVRDVFVRDLTTRVTTRASADAWGVQSSNPSTVAEGIGLTADGATVAFGSRASNLVPGDTNNAADVFVRTTGYPAATAPAAPGLVTVARGPGGSVVKWLVPDSGGAPVTGYTVTSSPDGLTAEVAGDATSATVEGLRHGIAYTFTVTATNDAGTGPSSPNSNAVVHQALPDAPAGVYAMRGTGLPIVRWVPPNYQGAGQLTGFQVIANPGNIVTTVAPNLRETTVANLVNGVSYKFTVKAVNAAGAGPASAPSGAVVSQTVPDVPGNVVAVRGDKAVTVRWTRPAFTGATALTGFVVTRTPGGVTTTVGPDATTATIGGLANGTQYAFTVYATNDNGRSRLSNLTALVTPATVSNLTIGAAPIAGAAAGAPRVTLTGRLVGADGNGIAGQQISLYGKAPSWKAWTLVGRVVTAADGTWSLAMTPAGPRNIYAAYAGSPGATAKTTGTVFVQ